MDKNDENKLFEPYTENDYPELIPIFPKEIYVTYAVCGKQCGNVEFIVDGQTQVCERCHKQLFRTETRKYVLLEDDQTMDDSGNNLHQR